MLEVIDVVIAVVAGTALGLFNYASVKKNLSRKGPNLTDRQRRWQQKLAQKELWEHAAHASAFGIAMFALFVFNSATNLSHFPYWPRIGITLAGFFAVFFILRLITRAFFQHYRNRRRDYSSFTE